MWKTRNVKDEYAHIWFKRDFKEVPVNIMLWVVVSTALTLTISLLAIQWNPQVPKSALKVILIVYNGMKIHSILEKVFFDWPKLNVSLVNKKVILTSYFGWKLLFKGLVNTHNSKIKLKTTYLTDVFANIWWERICAISQSTSLDSLLKAAN